MYGVRNPLGIVSAIHLPRRSPPDRASRICWSIRGTHRLCRPRSTVWPESPGPSVAGVPCAHKKKAPVNLQWLRVPRTAVAVPCAVHPDRRGQRGSPLLPTRSPGDVVPCDRGLGRTTGHRSGARAAHEDKLEGLQTGVDDYLEKPFSPKELLARVNNLIASRERLRRRYRTATVIKPSEI